MLPSMDRCHMTNNDSCTSAARYRADSRFVPSQWEMAFLCNDVSHWLGANLESSLRYIQQNITDLFCFLWFWSVWGYRWLASYLWPVTIWTIQDHMELTHWIFIQISLKFYPMGPINNKSALVQTMAWYQWGWHAIIWTNDGLSYWRIYASFGLNELTHWGWDKMDILQMIISNAFS